MSSFAASYCLCRMAVYMASTAYDNGMNELLFLWPLQRIRDVTGVPRTSKKIPNQSLRIVKIIAIPPTDNRKIPTFVPN